MAGFTIEIDDAPTAEDWSVVERGLTEHGEARSEPRRFERLAIFARDGAQRVVGGLRGATVWGWLEIEWLWVAEEHRNEGLGRRLMAAAEDEAVARGCRHARLDTFDFQAPAFYTKLGYEEFAALDDFPSGHTRHFMRKRNLAASRSPARARDRNPPPEGNSGVAIRPYTAGDASAVFEAARESVSDVMPWMPWCHPDYTLDDSLAWLEAQVLAFAEGTAFEFAIVSGDGRYLGGCGLNQLDGLHRRANLGYWVRSSAARSGVAPVAVRLLREWALRHTDLIRLEIVVAVGNLRSQRVAEKTGALREGVLRSRLHLHGRAHDAVVFSLTRTEGT